jgi:hypothetical protein
MSLQLDPQGASGDEHGSSSSESSDEDDRLVTEYGHYRASTKYLRTSKRPANYDTLLWWRANAERFPGIAKIARKYLCMQPSSAASERAFSLTGHIVGRRRTGLSIQTLEALACLRTWFVVHDCSDASIVSI